MIAIFSISSLPISPSWLVAIALNTILGAIALLLPRKVLTTAGICHAWALGITVWGCLGWQGYLVILSYLIIGSGVTRIGKDIKEAKGIAEKRDGARGPENLWGSAATGAVCAIGQAISPNPLWLVAYVASLSTKLADTTASDWCLWQAGIDVRHQRSIRWSRGHATAYSVPKRRTGVKNRWHLYEPERFSWSEGGAPAHGDGSVHKAITQCRKP